MRKENYGLPAGLLCISAYLIAFIGNYNIVGVIGLLALTITVFALGFDSRVKKTFVQATGLCLLFSACQFFFHGLGDIFSIDIGNSTWDYVLNEMDGVDKVFSVVYKLYIIVMYATYLLLVVAILSKVDIIVSFVHKSVDGFVPVRQYQPQQFANPQYSAQSMPQGQPMRQGQPVRQGQGMPEGQPMRQGRPVRQSQGVPEGQPMRQGQAMRQGQGMPEGQPMRQGRPMHQGQAVAEGQPMRQGQSMQQGHQFQRQPINNAQQAPQYSAQAQQFGNPQVFSGAGQSFVNQPNQFTGPQGQQAPQQAGQQTAASSQYDTME